MLATPTHIGADMRAERERLGLSLAQIAEELCVKESYLSLIEDGRKDGLPGVGYVLGYIRAYADFVGLDGKKAVERYKAEQSIPENLRLRDAPHIVTRRRTRLPRGLVSACLVLAVAVGFAAYYGAQNSDATVVAETPTDVAAAPNAVAGPDVFVLKAETASWIEITDRNGATVMSAILKPGQVVHIPRADGPVVNVRDAGAVSLSVGTRELGPLGPRGRSVEGLELIAYEGGAASGSL